MQTPRRGVHQLCDQDRTRGVVDGAERGGRHHVPHLLTEPASPAGAEPHAAPKPVECVCGLWETHLPGMWGSSYFGSHQGRLPCAMMSKTRLSMTCWLVIIDDVRTDWMVNSKGKLIIIIRRATTTATTTTEFRCRVDYQLTSVSSTCIANS